MSMECHSRDKEGLRRHFQSLLHSISDMRRNEAALQDIAPQFTGIVLSFFSTKSEIDLFGLNTALAQRKRLVLPRVEGEVIVPYYVRSLQGLIESAWGIKEPDPRLCEKVPLSAIDTILVPGLAFDADGNRLGRGLGLYDRFLSNLSAKMIGLGFKEQLYSGALPAEAHDVAMNELLLR